MKRRDIVPTKSRNAQPSSGIASAVSEEGLGFQAIDTLSEGGASTLREAASVKRPQPEISEEEEQEETEEVETVSSEEDSDPEGDYEIVQELTEAEVIQIEKSKKALMSAPQKAAQKTEPMIKIMPLESAKWSQGRTMYFVRRHVPAEVPLTLAKNIISLGKATLA